MTEFHRATPRYLYRLNPDNHAEVQMRGNKPRARWRHVSRHGSITQAESEKWRLVFLERDRKETL